MRPEHVTRTPTNDSAVLLSHVSVCITWPVYCTVIGRSSCHIRTYILHITVLVYNFDTVLCQFLETGTSDRCLIGIVQNLRFSGFSLYPLSFFLYSPFKFPDLDVHSSFLIISKDHRSDEKVTSFLELKPYFLYYYFRISRNFSVLEIFRKIIISWEIWRNF